MNRSGVLFLLREIRASWHGFQPRIDLENVVVSDGQGHEVVRLEHVGAIVSWWSLPLMEVRLESLQIDRPDVQIMRDRQGYFYLAGIRLENDDSDDRSVGDWVLKQHEIVIRDGTVHWKDEFRNDQELNLEQVGFVMKNRGRRHRFRLVAVPDTGLADSLDIRGICRTHDLQGTFRIFRNGKVNCMWMHRVSGWMNGNGLPIFLWKFKADQVLSGPGWRWMDSVCPV